MKVYLVFESHTFDSPTMIGCFKNKVAAEKACTEAEERFESDTIRVYEDLKQDYSFADQYPTLEDFQEYSRSNYTVSIEPVEVQE